MIVTIIANIAMIYFYHLIVMELVMTYESIDTLYKVCKGLFVWLLIILLSIELVCGFTISFILAVVAFICTLMILCPIIVMFKIASSLKNIEDVICYSKADKDVDELHYNEADKELHYGEAKDSKYIELEK